MMTSAQSLALTMLILHLSPAFAQDAPDPSKTQNVSVEDLLKIHLDPNDQRHAEGTNQKTFTSDVLDYGGEWHTLAAYHLYIEGRPNNTADFDKMVEIIPAPLFDMKLKVTPMVDPIEKKQEFQLSPHAKIRTLRKENRWRTAKFDLASSPKNIVGNFQDISDDQAYLPPYEPYRDFMNAFYRPGNSYRGGELYGCQVEKIERKYMFCSAAVLFEPEGRSSDYSDYLFELVSFILVKDPDS